MIESHLPIWAIIYSGLIFGSGIGTIIMNKDRTPLYIIMELLSTAFSISFFFIYYEKVAYPESISTILAMILFILYQEAWVNRKLYRFISDDNEVSENEKKPLLIFTIVFMFLLLSPFLWLVFEVLSRY